MIQGSFSQRLLCRALSTHTLHPLTRSVFVEDWRVLRPPLFSPGGYSPERGADLDEEAWGVRPSEELRV